MGNFRQNNHGGFNRGRSSGDRFGGRGRDFDRDRGRDREMFDVTCNKCGKPAKVPFKPTGDKPVLCSDCFRQNRETTSNSSNEQIDLINIKLDKILKILSNLEIVEDEEAMEDESEDFEDKGL